MEQAYPNTYTERSTNPKPTVQNSTELPISIIEIWSNQSWDFGRRSWVSNCLDFRPDLHQFIARLQSIFKASLRHETDVISSGGFQSSNPWQFFNSRFVFAQARLLEQPRRTYHHRIGQLALVHGVAYLDHCRTFIQSCRVPLTRWARLPSQHFHPEQPSRP